MEEQNNNEDKKIFEEKKIVADLTGEPKESKYEKFLIAEGERVGKFKSVELVVRSKFKQPDIKESTIVAQVEVNEKDKLIELPLFLNPLVTKSYEGSSKSDSALYTVLSNLELLQEFSDSNGAAQGFTQGQLAIWLKNLLVGKTARVLVQTTVKAVTPYSKIGKVYGFVEDEPKSNSKIVTSKDSGVVSEEKVVREIK